MDKQSAYFSYALFLGFLTRSKYQDLMKFCGNLYLGQIVPAIAPWHSLFSLCAIFSQSLAVSYFFKATVMERR